jgi:hypothetical protein
MLARYNQVSVTIDNFISASLDFNGVMWISDQHSKQVASVPGVEWKVVPQ